MFHPRPFVKTRFAPQGAVACLTAVSNFYYTVVFRCVALAARPSLPLGTWGSRQLRGSANTRHLGSWALSLSFPR